MTDTSEHQTIYEFSRSRAFQVEIIKIIRGDKLINMPKSDEMVLSGDILHMMGTHDEIEACMMLLEKEDRIEYTEQTGCDFKRLSLCTDFLWDRAGTSAHMLSDSGSVLTRNFCVDPLKTRESVNDIVEQ